MKGQAAKNARRKRRIEIIKAKRALCKTSSASSAYIFLSLPPSSPYYNRKVCTDSGAIPKTSIQTTVTTTTTRMDSQTKPILSQDKKQLNTRGLNKDEVRKQRNRLSAENSRQKKLAIENELRAKIAILEKENGSLRQRVQKLEYNGDDGRDKMRISCGFDENACNNIMMNVRHSSEFIPAA